MTLSLFLLLFLYIFSTYCVAIPIYNKYKVQIIEEFLEPNNKINEKKFSYSLFSYSVWYSYAMLYIRVLGWKLVYV